MSRSTAWSARRANAARRRTSTSQIAEINAEYALVLAGNKAAVMKFEDKTKFRLLQVGAFKQWFANQSVHVGKKVISLGDYWLGHPERRQYAAASSSRRRDPPPAPATTICFRGLPSSPGRATARSFWRT